MASLTKIKKKAKEIDVSNLRPIRVAILGNHATQFFKDGVKYNLIIKGFNPEIFESDYNQIDITLLDVNSGLFKLKPSFVIILESTLSLQKEFQSISVNSDRTIFYEKKYEQIYNRVAIVKQTLPETKILIYSYETILDNVFGNFYSKVNESFSYQLTELNYRMFLLAKEQKAVYLLDINAYLPSQNQHRDWSLFINADLHYSLDTYVKLAYSASQTIISSTGKIKKCLVLDLDNTTWGGIIGDDGINGIQIGSDGIGKAFQALQKWAKELKNRGIILAVCSKNEESIAKTPFEEHPEMVLRLSDIAVFIANWKNKADNIRHIKEVLNIGYDSMVFLDDNPMERNIVKENLPDVTVPELPSDPALYLPYLNELNLFETTSYSKGDKDRTKQYQQEAKRKKTITSYTNMDDYLASLKMEAEVGPFLDSDIPRIAQLTQRSNQFNLRTIRYSEPDIEKFRKSEKYLTYSVKLQDKFGSYGLISVIILEKKELGTYFMDTWLMSCRVLKRGVENMVMNQICKDLKRLETVTIKGEYIKTPKNDLVASLLPSLGLKREGDTNLYSVQIDEIPHINHFIKKA